MNTTGQGTQKDFEFNSSIGATPTQVWIKECVIDGQGGPWHGDKCGNADLLIETAA